MKGDYCHFYQLFVKTFIRLTLKIKHMKIEFDLRDKGTNKIKLLYIICLVFITIRYYNILFILHVQQETLNKGGAIYTQIITL